MARKGFIGLLASIVLVVSLGTVIVAADGFQNVTTWSNLFVTGIKSEFEAGKYGSGDWGTDPTRIVTQCWAACQDGANGEVDINYSPKVTPSSIGHYEAWVEHANNWFVTTYKYYGWIYD